MQDTRPDPDALLARTQGDQTQPRRGRLKIFFGASPGVGKTFAMLSEARERKAAGVGVVIGYVEAHKRPETLALLDGLEALAPRSVDYRGVQLSEFDLDAALTRKPDLILVDELAHTNAEGLRHAKRWQDVSELLEAGIDVYTTVNVQHIESLNDVVAQVTGVRVRETIPDAVIDRADEIELIDLPPDDLLQRLREGRVYFSEQAERAAEHFFRKESLVALRELALRRTADRVNQQVQVEKAGHAISRTWATAERLLVCVGPSPLSARVIRSARRMATSMRCDWLAVAVDTPQTSDQTRERIRKHLRLAENLGGEPLVITGERVAEELISFARKRQVTRIIIGKPSLARWRELIRGSIVNDLIRLSGDIDVHVVKGEREDTGERASFGQGLHTNWRPYLGGVGLVGLATGIAWPLQGILQPVNLTMIYLAAVVFAATRFPVGPSALAAVLSALAFDFFFTVPYFSFAISDTQYVITCGALLVTSVVVSGLTQRVRRQAEAIRVRYHRTAALYFMSRQLAAAPDRQMLLQIAARHIADVFAGDVAILIPGADGSLAPHDPNADWVRGNECGAARWVFDHQKWAGRGTDTLPACQAIYVPLVASGKPLGVMGLRQRPASPLEPDQRHMLETFATQLSIALERDSFASEAANARVAAEAEQTRNALLSCVSHDLRTPLATIAGSASSLLIDETNLQRRELLRSIYEEGGRLNQLVGKLLEMTRLESPGFRLTPDWFPPAELVGTALTRLEEALREHEVRTNLPAELPLVLADGILLEEVLTNFIENAARYAPARSIIEISAHATPDALLFEVRDSGPGIPDGAEKAVFDKFHRERPGADRLGTGLGLAICRTIIQLHGGSIGVQNRTGGGACFWFTIPRAAAPSPPTGRLEERELSSNLPVDRPAEAIR